VGSVSKSRTRVYPTSEFFSAAAAFSTAAFVSFVVSSLPSFAQNLSDMPLEKAAYYHVSSKPGERNYKAEYMKKLSPGGRVYFLACRRDYKEALDALAKLPKSNTGSHLYMKAYLLENLDQHPEAMKNYRAARAQIGKGTKFVFSPGWRFYMHFATAAINTNNEKECNDALDEVEPKSLERAPNSNYPRYLLNEVKKRRLLFSERRGLYKKAFDDYLSLFTDNSSDQFHLDQPLAGDKRSKAVAENWLRANPVKPLSNPPQQLAIYYLTAGKANLSSGNTKASIPFLILAGTKRPRNAWKITGEDPRIMRSVNDEANKLLVKIYYKEKNYPKCCQYIRALFSDEPFTALKTLYNTLSMHDFPQLVDEHDEKAHDESLEGDLDLKDFAPEPRNPRLL